MILDSPWIDLALSLALMALALIAGIDFARAGWPDALALCVIGFFGGLVWFRALVSVAPHEAEGEDG